MEMLAWIFGLALLATLLWHLVDQWDRRCVAAHLRQRGGRPLSINWSPRGKSWFGEQAERLYEVVYYDREGDLHLATCKVRLLCKIRFTDDRIAHCRASWQSHLQEYETRGIPLIHAIPREDQVARGDELSQLREENKRLREELASRPARDAGPT